MTNTALQTYIRPTLLAAALACAVQAHAAPVALPAYNVDLNQSSVSGPCMAASAFGAHRPTRL